MQMCFIFYFYLFLTVSQKMPGGMDALALLYFAKIWGLYVRTIGICRYGYIHGYIYGYIHGYPWKICG